MIPISKPFIGESELEAVRRPLTTGWLVQGPGVAEFERGFAAFCGITHAVATTSCTTALHAALAALGAGPGDEVIVPAFTWIATPNAVAYTGATPVFCDIDLTTFNLDPAALAAAVTPRTVGIVPVHLFGRLAPVDAVAVTAQRHGLWVLEDAACAFGSRRGADHAGAFGAAACFSFHPRKSITTGEGGMVLTDDTVLADHVRRLRDHGASRSDFARHSAPRSYELAEYAELGFNYRMTDLQAALGLAQLDRATWLLAERARLAERYADGLADLDWLTLPDVPADETHGWQSYVTLHAGAREPVMDALEARGIATRAGTLAVHRTALYGLPAEACPAATAAEERSIALPLYPGLTDAEQDQVIEALHTEGP